MDYLGAIICLVLNTDSRSRLYWSLNGEVSYDASIELKMDPKERTKRMLEAERQKFLEHERRSRESKGRTQAPLSTKLKVALPLVGIVFGLYIFSIFKTRQHLRKKNDRDDGPVEVQELHGIVPEPEPLSEVERRSYMIWGTKTPDLGPEFLADDVDKKW